MRNYLTALGIYFVIDVAYQFAIGMRLGDHFITGTLREVYGSPGGSAIVLIALFFLIIAYANLKLCIERGIEQRDWTLAAKLGALLGTAAYGTLALANGWTFADYPLGYVCTVTFEGILFSTITSGATTYLALRRLGEA